MVKGEAEGMFASAEVNILLTWWSVVFTFPVSPKV